MATLHWYIFVTLSPSCFRGYFMVVYDESRRNSGVVKSSKPTSPNFLLSKDAWFTFISPPNIYSDMLSDKQFFTVIINHKSRQHYGIDRTPTLLYAYIAGEITSFLSKSLLIKMYSDPLRMTRDVVTAWFSLSIYKCSFMTSCAGMEYSEQIKPMSCVLMPETLTSPCHQQVIFNSWKLMFLIYMGWTSTT